MTEDGPRWILHAPHVDLVELDACAARLGQAARLVEGSATRTIDGTSTTRVAPTRVLDALPGLPLLHHRNLLSTRLGGMEAVATWTLGTTGEDRSAAVATLEARCEPALGRLVVEERVRTDLSNAPGPGSADANERIARSVRRLERMVRDRAAVVRAAMAGGDPEDAAGEAEAAIVAAAWPFATAAWEEAGSEDGDDDDPIDSARIEAVVGGPYGPNRLRHRAFGEDGTTPILSPEADAAFAALVMPVVGLEIDHRAGGVRYRFGPVVARVPVDDAEHDPVAEMRRLRRIAEVPSPAWIGR